jgi:aminopeptidase N
MSATTGNNQPTRVYLKDYQAPDFTVHSVDIDFDLHEDFCRVRAKIELESLKIGAPLVLNGHKLDLRGLKMNQRELSPDEFIRTDDLLTIPKASCWKSKPGLNPR